MIVARGFRLIGHFLDPQPPGSRRDPPLHDVAGTVADQRRADRRQDRYCPRSKSASLGDPSWITISLPESRSVTPDTGIHCDYGGGDLLPTRDSYGPVRFFFQMLQVCPVLLIPALRSLQQFAETRHIVIGNVNVSLCHKCLLRSPCKKKKAQGLDYCQQGCSLRSFRTAIGQILESSFRTAERNLIQWLKPRHPKEDARSGPDGMNPILQTVCPVPSQHHRPEIGRYHRAEMVGAEAAAVPGGAALSGHRTGSQRRTGASKSVAAANRGIGIPHYRA